MLRSKRHGADHVAADHDGGMASKCASLAVPRRRYGGAVELVPGRDEKVTVRAQHVQPHVIRGLRRTEQHGAPRACANRTISRAGVMVPSAFDMWVMAAMRVRGVSRRSNLEMRSPRSSIGATVSLARRSHTSCQGTMLNGAPSPRLSTSCRASTAPREAVGPRG